MRSITHAGIIELIKHTKGENWVKDAIAKIIRRPDDILEMVGYWMNHAPDHEKAGLPASIRKGIALALEKFDAYQLAKYKGNKSNVKLVDIFNLVHPKPKTPERAEIYKKLMKGELVSTETWEAKLSKAGQMGETEEEVDSLKENAWKELIDSGRIGYFALLKNLRNIVEQSPDSLISACKMLTDKKLIEKSLVLPFRYLTACDALHELAQKKSQFVPLVNQVLVALNEAMVISCKNAPEFEGISLVVLDTSGSMSGKPMQIGSLFAGVFIKSNAADMMVFSDNARYLLINRNDSLVTLVNTIKANSYYGGTNFHSIFKTANKKYDRIIILSDMQGWMGYDTPKNDFENYKKRTGASPFIYSIDLQGQGTMQLPEKDIFCLAGFSDKIFDIIKNMEQDKNALINKIKTIDI